MENKKGPAQDNSTWSWEYADRLDIVSRRGIEWVRSKAKEWGSGRRGLGDLVMLISFD